MIEAVLLKRVAVDISCLLIVTGATLGINFSPVYMRGYFKDDESIMFPYKSDTVPEWTLGVINLPVIMIFILIFEIFAAKKINFKDKYHGFLKFVVYFYRYSFALCFGFVITLFFVVIGKQTIGRLRPHFFSVCDPKPIEEIKAFKYVISYECQNTLLADKHEDMNKSFPSGHSAAAMFNACFLIDYIRRRIPSKRLFVPLGTLLQTVAFGCGFWVCLTRITDHKHHWSDVLFGGVLGTIIAFVNPYLVNFVHYENLQDEGIDNSNESSNKKNSLDTQEAKKTESMRKIDKKKNPPPKSIKRNSQAPQDSTGKDPEPISIDD